MPHRRYKHVDPRRYYTRFTTAIGRRGTVLLLLGLIWLFSGLSVFTAPESTSYSLLQSNELLRGGAWIFTGLVAIVTARVPPGRDAWGFLALYFMAAYRVAAYAIEFLEWMFPGGNGGNPRGIVGALAWITILILIVVVAGWKEPTEEDV